MATAAKTSPSKAGVPATKPSTNMVVDQRPNYIKETGNAGNENVGANDLVIPRLELVQALSPARKRNDPGFIVGAEEGMLYNSLTRELYGPTALIVPVYYRVEHMVWIHRKAGGGFRGSFLNVGEARERLARVLEEENPSYTEGSGPNATKVDNAAEIVDTPQHFALVITENGVAEIVVSMPRTKAKMSRKFNSLIRMTPGDRFSRVYEFSGKVEQNASGEDYHNFDVKVLGYPTKEVYERAKSTYAMISRGTGFKVDTGDMDGEEAPPPDDAEM